MKVRKFSHSSGEVDVDKDHLKPSDNTSSSVNKLELTLGSITTSQSENALKSIRSGFTNATSNVLTSPSAVAVLSPLTKLAKGKDHFLLQIYEVLSSPLNRIGASVKTFTVNVNDEFCNENLKINDSIAFLSIGMQSLGANLDIRRLKQTKTNYEATAETKRLQDMWITSKCRSKLIAV